MPTDEQNGRSIERSLLGMSPGNQETARDFLRQKRVQGCKPATAKNYALLFAHLDRFGNARPFASLQAADLTAFLEARGTRLAPASLYHASILLNHFLRWLLRDDRLPRDFRLALKVNQPRRLKSVRPVEAEEFHGLLEYAHDLRSQAILWTLWDSGFRIGELVSLNVGSVEFDGRGGARLRLSEGASGLKTGSRTVYVVDCVGPLKAWLAVHPSGDREAALFASKDPKAFGRRPVPHTINRSLTWWCQGAGIRPLYPHLFRHARATRAARSGWVESQMRAYFGWTASSVTPSIYTHLASADMEAQVRRDAGIDNAGQIRSTGVIDDVGFERRMKSFLRKMLLEDTGASG